MGKLKFTNAQIESMIQGIEDGTIDAENLPVDYYQAFVNYIKDGLYEGFGGTLETVSELDLPLLEELTTNCYMFGAAKTFQQTIEISSLLVDTETGEIRTSREFNRLAREKYDEWNDNWGRTEYNTAVAQGDSAAKWNEIERQKDVMPVLRYSTIGDACDICQPLDNLTAPVDSPIWDKVAPTNHFNCRCIVTQETADAQLTPDPNNVVDPVVGKMKEKGQDIFVNNVGKTGQVFTKDHPYFDVTKEYRELAKQNFGLPIPEMQGLSGKPELVSEHPNLPKQFKEWGIAVNKELADLLETPFTARQGSRGLSYVTPSKNQLTLDMGKRYKDSTVHREQVIHHEVGHLIHEQNGIINFGKSVSEEYANHFKELRKLVGDPSEVQKRISTLYKEILADEKKLEKYGCKNRHDVKELFGAVNDSFMALTNGKFGGGHTKSYMKGIGAKESEMFAHSMENKFGGNPVFKEVMPEVYKKSIDYIDKLIKSKVAQ